jgi:arylsulfatase A-like enzyme
MSFVLVALLAVLAFHANDLRLPEELSSAVEAHGLPGQSGLLQSVMRGNLPTSFPAGQLSNRDQIADFAGRYRTADVRVTSSSVRFSRPWQINVSIGTYPGRVEARDGVFVPPGGTVSARMPAVPGRIQFGLAVLDGSEVWGSSSSAETWSAVTGSPVRMSHRLFRWLDLRAPSLSGRLSKWMFQFIRPASALSSLTGRRWLDFTLPWQGSAEDPAKRIEWTLRCDSAVPCVFSDIEFLPDANQPDKESAPQPDIPNFVVVVIDTLRADAVHAGDAPVSFSSFVARSASFVRGLSPGNMTSPSTNAFLGCRTPTELKSIAFAYAVSEDSRQQYYRTRADSFPAKFTAAGYKTAMIGNISVVSEVIGVGVDHGFQENISLEVEGYETALAGLVARKWIQEQKGKPFFLYVHLNAPHAPYKAPLRDVFATWPGFSRVQSLGDALRWLYAGEVRYAARTFDGILKELEAAGIAANTHVILTGDHGDQHVTRRFSGNEAGPVASGAFFDHGATLLDDEINVPLIWRGPGVIPSRHHTHVSTLGVGPAMIDMASASGANISSGTSCSAAARAAGNTLLSRVMPGNSKDGPPLPRPFGLEGYQQRGVVFDGRYKYIRAHEPVSKKLVPPSGWSVTRHEFFAREQLFDLDADPQESLNLAGRDTTLLMRARREYDRFYQVNTAFELVVEAPGGEPVEVPALGFHGSGSKRVVIPVPAGVRASDLAVKVGGKAVKISGASLRLPLPASQWQRLPREPGGEDALLAARSTPNAYVRRVLVNDGEVRRIVSGNPMFDQVLRDWGYLHDD